MLFATALSNDSMADAIDAHRGVMVELAREVLRVARANGVAPLGFDGFSPSVIESGDGLSESRDALVVVRRGDEETHSGVWCDLAVRKRRTEVDAHFVPIVLDAARHGLPVPLLERMMAMIHVIEDGQREFASANIAELASVGASTV